MNITKLTILCALTALFTFAFLNTGCSTLPKKAEATESVVTTAAPIKAPARIVAARACLFTVQKNTYFPNIGFKGF